MRNPTKKKQAAIICTLVVLVFAAIYLAIMLFALLVSRGEAMVAYLVVAIYCAVVIAVIAGVLGALRQRLREIDGGEEEESKKY